MAQYLPAAAYQSPPRLARATQLNTIIEDHETPFGSGSGSGSGTDTDEGTVIGRPAGLDAKYFVAAPKKSKLATVSTPTPSTFSDDSSPSSAKDGNQNVMGFDDLYDASDASDHETEFSDSCPSLRDSISSDPTSFATGSNRNSGGSTKSNRNRYPSITIPETTAWSSITSPMKASPMPPSTPSKISLSPAVLSRIARWVPAPNVPPSLGDASSVTSGSDHMPNISAPVTPEMHNIMEGQSWGGPDQMQVRLRQEPESARDVDSDSMSPQDEVLIEGSIGDWTEMLGHFPRIPGATPQEHSPIPPNIDNVPPQSDDTSPDIGVQLPEEALRTLNRLVPDRKSPDLRSDASIQKEMRERSDPPSRPRSLDGQTPISDYSGYSFSKLSIPSPGGFFSSLKGGARHTWCPSQSNPSTEPPSSAMAENFYSLPWPQTHPERIVERVL